MLIVCQLSMKATVVGRAAALFLIVVIVVAVVVRLGRRFRLHEFRYVVDSVLGRTDLVEVVHPAGELRRDRALGTTFLLLEVFLLLLPFRGSRRTEVAFPCRGRS
jgi:hypothetical protein